MSLRYQINLRILVTLLIVLTLGGATLILQARQSVSKEVQSSVQLALQLIKLSINKTYYHQVAHNIWLRDITLVKEIHHLNIQLQQQSGQLLRPTQALHPQHIQTPQWFVWLVAKPYPAVSYPITTRDNKTVQIMISVNALDEISEAWQETKVFFAVILLLSGGLFLAVNLIFSQVLQTVERILKNLSEIETENYQNPLPHFAITEFERIAVAINHLTATLHKACQENNRLTLHSLEIQEEQRQTLAQELHDELGQSITAIKVMAVAAGKKSTSNQLEIYQSISQVCDYLVTVVRSMMKNLHPLILTELGLSASLHDLISHWQSRNTGLEISLHCHDEVDAMEAKKAIQIFRMVQEGITNAVRHAQAHHLLISLSLDNEHQNLTLAIADDGVGCDLQTLSRGFGLLGMQARVKSLQGTMQIISAKNQGMKITVIIP